MKTPTTPPITPTTKTVLITGCSAGGIGAAIATAFQQHPSQNYHIFATARTISKIPLSLSSSPNNITILPLDVTSSDSITQAVRTVTAQTGGRLDILINNCGFALIGQPAADIDLEIAREMFEVNYFGVVAVTSAFMPLLVLAKGVVVNNSSFVAAKWIMYNALYASTKAALNTYSETLRLEVAALGVRVVILMTGVIRTKVLENQPEFEIPETSFFKPIEGFLRGVPKSADAIRATSADEYARQVVRVVESGVSGKVWLGAMSGMIKHISWWIPEWVWDRMNYARNTEQHKLTVAADRWRSEVSS